MFIQETALTKDAKADKIELSEAVFGVPFNEGLVHQVITAYMNNARSATKKNKSRSDVAGGGAKPFRQKGTGRARAGTIRSPLWRSGGKTFTGQANFSQKVNKKMYRSAMKCILSEFVRQENLQIVDKLELSDHKTKTFLAFTSEHGFEKATYIVDELTVEFFLASRNIHSVIIFDALGIDPYSLFRSKKLVFTKEAIKQIEERLS